MKKRWMSVGVALLCIVSVLFCSTGVKADGIHESELEKYIMGEMSSAHVMGMSIAIVNSEKELYCAAYGSAQKTDLDFVLGDLTKSFTAAAIMRLAEDGELRLEDPVGDYLPEYKKIADVTIEQLLNHTSGITMYETMDQIEAKGTKGKFEYAHANYNLLGKIIEAITEVSYEEYVSDNILDPLEMESTYSLESSALHGNNMVTGYQNYLGFPFAKKSQYNADENWMQVSSSYLVSDVKDMGNYLQMYLKNGGDVLSKESIERMLHQGVSTESDTCFKVDLFQGNGEYGLGWTKKKVNDSEVLYHYGAVENYSGVMALLPEQEMGIVMMFDCADQLVGQKLIQKLAEGVISLEMGDAPGKINGNSYYKVHGVVDGLILVALLGAWMPIFLMGVWYKRRRNHVGNVPGIIIDVVIHVVLPTILLVALPQCVSVMNIRRFEPELFYAALAVIASLYLGAIVKGIAMAVFCIVGPKEMAEEEKPEKESLEEKKEEKNENKSSEEKKEEKNENKSSEEKKEEKNEDKSSEEKKEEKTEDKSSEEKKEEKTEEKSSEEKKKETESEEK